jgi:hypothetical protein
MAQALPLIMLAGSAALSAGGQIMAGNEKARAAEFEQQQLYGQQQQLKIQEENTRIQATQLEARRREELASSMETVQSIRAGRGVGQASPTGMAIFDSLVGNAERDIFTERFNVLSKADQSKRAAENAGLAAEMAGRKAKTSLLAGYLGAGETVLSAGYKASTYSPRAA